MQISELIETVQQNCHISDARYAGDYTLCIYLLKMREYYRWEQGLPLTTTIPKEDIGAWLAEREQTWDKLEDDDFAHLSVAGEPRDPFDDTSINTHLLPAGYIYSSGAGIYNKPHFFIGDLERREQLNGTTILVSGREYARDLESPPSMLRDNTVFIRKESLRRFLWEKLDEWSLNKSKSNSIGQALAPYYPHKDMEQVLDQITEREIDTLILHELGEVQAGEILGPDWEGMLASFPRTRLEIMARAVRDLIADTLSTLPELLEQEEPASLHFYFANYTGMRRHLFPSLHNAYLNWSQGGSKQALHETVKRGCDRWRKAAQSVLAAYQQTPNDIDSLEKILENS